VINLEKCVFAVPEFEFLGHRVSSAGARPLTSYVEAVASMAPPHYCKGLADFPWPN